METNPLDQISKAPDSERVFPVAAAYNHADRNAWLVGWNPQQELWNGRLAMIGFVAYLLWDMAGFSVVRDVLHLVR
jgi:hypothetical protein